MTLWPCRNCEQRTAGCHAICEQYQAIKKDHDANREARAAKKNLEVNPRLVLKSKKHPSR